MMRFTASLPGKAAFPGMIYTAAESQVYDQRERRVVDLLVAAGVDLNGQAGTLTPLMDALEVGHYAAARALLDHGADPSLRDERGNTAILYLVEYPKEGPLPLDLFERLLKRSGNLNVDPRPVGDSSLDDLSIMEEINAPTSMPSADRSSFREAAKMLIASGVVFPGITDQKVQTLLQAAAEGNLARVQGTIREGVSINAADGNGWNALTISVGLGYDEAADWLLAHGADATAHNRTVVYSPLRFAVQRGQADLVDKLISKGATPAGSNDLVYLAVQQNNAHIFDALLRAGADPKSSNGVTMTMNGETFTPRDSLPLFLCIENGQVAMAKTLLDRGANPDPTNTQDKHDLAYWAVEYDQPQILQALLDHGADPTRKGDDGDSTLSLARKSHPEMMPMLEAAIKRAQEENNAEEARGRAAMNHKLEGMIIPRADFYALPLSGTIEFLRQESVRLDTDPDPRQRGINIFLKLPRADASPAPAPSPGAGNAAGTPPTKTADRPITLTANQRPLLEVLRAVAHQVDMQVKVERYAVSLVPLSEQTEPLQTVEIIVAPGVFGVPATPSTAAAGEHTPSTTRVDAVSWLKGKGVTFPVGTSATYLPASQKLVVRNTQENINRLKALFPPPTAAR